jgi:hypothetical protein
MKFRGVNYGELESKDGHSEEGMFCLKTLTFWSSGPGVVSQYSLFLPGDSTTNQPSSGSI